MADETLTIYVWPDDSWESEEEIDDMDWFLSSSGKSDDYASYEVPLDLEAEDIDELIMLKALPGMIPPKDEIETSLEKGLDLPADSILVITVPDGDSSAYITKLEGKIIINADNMGLQVLNAGGKNA